MKNLSAYVGYAELQMYSSSYQEHELRSRLQSKGLSQEEADEVIAEAKSNMRISEKQKMFKRPFSLSGRIRRLEYCLSKIFATICLSFVSILIVIFEDYANQKMPGLIKLLMFVPIFWYIIAAEVKRSHDIGNSGWYTFIPFYYLWLTFKDGDKGRNIYGHDPKGRMGYLR